MRLRILVAATVATLVTAACGQAGTDTESSAPDPTTSQTSTSGPTTIPDVVSTSTTMAWAPPTTTAPPVTATTQPPTTQPDGEPYDFWVPTPGEGTIVGVVGVRHDDTLNVRSGPNVASDVVTTLPPGQTGIAGTGDGWQLPSGSVWWKIEADGVVGWANQRYLSRISGVDDLTSLVVGKLGVVPVAETMTDLGLIVATAIADVDSGADVVMSVAPTVGDLGDVTFDVVGLGDDSMGGYRLHVFGQPTAGGEGFSLMAVEATTLCQRGVHDGVCL